MRAALPSRRLTALLFFSLVFSTASAPLLASPKDELEKTQKAMEESRNRQAELASNSRRLESELRSIQEKMVQLAATIQKTESDISAMEDKSRLLDEQVAAKNAAIAERKKHLAGLTDAALRLSRMPPEAIVMMPGDITQTMKAARALKIASDSIQQETRSMGLQLAELQKLKDDVAKARDELSARQKTLDEQRQSLAARMQERKDAQEKLGQERREEANKLSRLAKKAEDLKDLISKLAEEEEKRREAENEARKTNMRSFAAAKGTIRMPASGRIVTRYGATQGKNASSRGITIETRPGAQVTAPFDGEVVYAGSFLNYGRMVILRHSDDFHTLLAGLTKIDAGVGQFLLEGEPIGAMGEGTSSNRLYLELRKNNLPVDPAQWVAGAKTRNQEKQ